MGLDGPLGVINLAVHIHPAIAVHRPPLADEGIGEPKVYHAVAYPVIGDLEAVDQMHLRVVAFIDNTLSLYPLTEAEPLFPCACQLVQATNVDDPLISPFLFVVIVQPRIVLVPALEQQGCALIASLLDPMIRRTRVGVAYDQLVGDHVVPEPRG